MVRYLVLYQIMAMARYEALMMWRRGSLRIIVAGLIMLPLLYLVVTREAYLASLQASQIPDDAVSHLATRTMILTTFPLLAIILVAIPIILTEVIPFDCQYRVQDCLRALPLAHHTYLIGKVAGTWLGLALAMALACMVIGLAGHFLIGGFDLQIWLRLWGGGLLLFTLFAGGLSVLLSAGQPNRRRAVLVGVILVMVDVAIYLWTPLNFFIIRLISISYVVDSEMNVNMNMPLLPVMTLPALLGGLGILIVAGLLAWGWHVWQEYR